MFVLLGLLTWPGRLPERALPALVVALALMLAARPVAVFLCLAPFRFSWREKAFMSWVGLRGAVGIFLASIPLLVRLPQAQLYFDVGPAAGSRRGDRKSTRLNSSHQIISYAVFCLKKKKKNLLSSSEHTWWPVLSCTTHASLSQRTETLGTEYVHVRQHRQRSGAASASRLLTRLHE